MIQIHIIEHAPAPRRFANEIESYRGASPIAEMLIRANQKIERLRRSVSTAAEQIVRAGELLRAANEKIDRLEKDKDALIRALHRASH